MGIYDKNIRKRCSQMQIKGLYKKGKNHTFFIKGNKSKKLIECIDIAPSLKDNLPIIVEGEQDKDFEHILHVKEIAIDFNNRDKMIAFLSGRAFSNVDKTKASKIYDSLIYEVAKKGLDAIDSLEPQDIIEVATKYIPEESAIAIAVELCGLKSRMELCNLIMKNGGSFIHAENAYQMYSGAATKTLMENPYAGIDCDIPFDVCDRIAKHNKVSPRDKYRINALLNAIAKDIEAQGCCCQMKHSILDIAKRLQRRSPYKPLSDMYILLAIASSRNFVVTESRRGLLVYPRKLYAIEQQIVAEIRRLMKNPQPTGYKGYTGNALDEDQVKCTDFIYKSGIYIITGGPGSGKTTTIKTLIQAYKSCQPYRGVYLCAPTGRAAVRISESINIDEYKGQTIHKLIGIVAVGNSYEPTYNRESQLPIGIYVADEMSMVDEKVFLQFLSAIPSGSTVILSGDPYQLQSVASGAVLQDLIESKVIPCVTLTKIHRQGETSKIVENYYRIRDMKDSLIEGDDCKIVRRSETKELLDVLFNIYNEHKNDQVFDFQILTFTRKGTLGSVNINNLIAQYLNKPHKFISTKVAVDDKVMMIRNNYQTGYFNGDVGTVKRFDSESIDVQFYDGEKTILRDDAICDMEHSWASTVHKSQGSEYKTVVLIVSKEYKSMLYNSILLTGVTRAKTNLIILSQDDALEQALQCSKKNERITGLAEMLSRES